MSHSSTITAEGRHTWNGAQVGVIAFLVSEISFFSTLLVSHLTLNASAQGESGARLLSLKSAAVGTGCLLLSSLMLHAAEGQFIRKNLQRFRILWGLSLMLGVSFLSVTLAEWSHLIREQGLTISRDVFGSTFYTVVGFHALHVTCGILALGVILLITSDRSDAASRTGVQLVGWYWHFVDAVWVVVVGVVYLAPRLAAWGGMP